MGKEEDVAFSTGSDGVDKQYLDNEKAPQRYGSAVLEAGELEQLQQSTKRGLKSRHAQMIALGGTIGTGLFVGSGATLARGGPAFILVCYIILTILILFIITAIVEVAAHLPVPGGTMSYFGFRYVSSSLGFAMGWLYWYSLGILVPYEITAAGLVIDYWESPVNVGVWITIFIIAIVGLNCFPVSVYGETEFWFAGTKVLMMIGLLILSFILFWGGGPEQHGILGFHYWKDPGPANTWLKTGDAGRVIAFFSTLVLSAFPFTFAAELIVVTGGEMKNPRRNLPVAAKRYIYRLVIFYVGCVLAIGVICSSKDSALTDGGAGAKSAAFVVGIKNAGIKGLDSVINAVIIISAWSSGNSFLYISSRSLYSMAVAGNAPGVFKKCTKKGVPYMAVGASALFTPLAYLNCASSGSTVFTWFVNLTNTSGFISWICCCIVYLRFNKACKAQGWTDLPYHSWCQPYGAWIAMVMFTILVLINGFDVFFPERFSASSFLTAYVGIPIFLCIYFGHRILHRHDTWARDPLEVDLTTGLQDMKDAEVPKKKHYDHWWEYARQDNGASSPVAYHLRLPSSRTIDSIQQMLSKGRRLYALSCQSRMSTGSKVEVPQPGQDTSIDVPQRSPSPRLRNPDHVANTGVDEESTYVLTLRTDRDFHQRINDLRKLYFPPQLNKIGAHITLFHALPGSQLQAITSDLQTAAQIHTPFAIQIHEPLRLSRGVALNAKHKKAEEIFNTLKLKWGPTGANFLSKQDQHFKAHYTIQNKAEKEVAQSTWEEVRDGFKRDEGLAIGLTLYKYLRGGYWKFQRHFDFVESIAPIMSPAQFPLLGTASS